MTLSGIDLDAADVRRDGRFPAALAFSYVFRSGSAKLEGKADFKGAIDLAGLVPSRVAARADSIRIRFEDLAVKAYADFHDAEEPDLVLHIRDATAPFLAGARGEARVREAGSLATSGTLDIGRISHPNFTAAGASVEWSLDHADDLSRVTGRAKLKASDGNFQNLKDFTSGSPLLRAALFPLLALQKAGGLAKIRVLPAFDRVRYKEITGDYAVQNGIVTVKESHLDSSAAYVVAAGGADLGKDRVDLRLSTRLAAGLGADISGPIGFTVTGPLSDPSVKFDAASILKQPAVQNAVKQGQQLLRGLFQ